MEAGSPGRWQRNRIIESNLKRRFSLVPLFTLKMRVTKERNPWPQASKGGFLHGPSHKKRTTADLIRSATLFLSNMVTGSAAAERHIEVLVIIIL